MTSAEPLAFVAGMVQAGSGIELTRGAARLLVSVDDIDPTLPLGFTNGLFAAIVSAP